MAHGADTRRPCTDYYPPEKPGELKYKTAKDLTIEAKKELEDTMVRKPGGVRGIPAEEKAARISKYDYILQALHEAHLKLDMEITKPAPMPR